MSAFKALSGRRFSDLSFNRVNRQTFIASTLLGAGGISCSLPLMPEGFSAVPFAAAQVMGVVGLFYGNISLLQATTRRRLHFRLRSSFFNCGQFAALALAGNANAVNGVAMLSLSAARAILLHHYTDKMTGASSLTSEKRKTISLGFAAAGSAFFGYRIGFNGVHEILGGHVAGHAGELGPLAASWLYLGSEVFEKHRYARLVRPLAAAINVGTGICITRAFAHVANEISEIAFNVLAIRKLDMPPIKVRNLRSAAKLVRSYVQHLHDFKAPNVNPVRKKLALYASLAEIARELPADDNTLSNLVVTTKGVELSRVWKIEANSSCVGPGEKPKRCARLLAMAGCIQMRS